MVKSTKKRSVTVKEIEEYVIGAGSDSVAVFGGEYEGGIQCQQVPDEIAPCLYEILNAPIGIRSYLEVGAAAGGTVFLINEYLKPVNIVVIDDNKHPKQHIRPYILKDVPHFEIIGASQDQRVTASLTELDLTFDLILIDGDHTYPGVKMDVELYRNFLNEGGFLMLHDSNLPEWGVKTVVEELKQDSKGGLVFVEEYVSETHPHPCGVALFRKEARLDED